MAHEKSITVKKGGRYYNLDNSGGGKGNVLGRQGGYSTEREAVKAAKRRSDKYETRGKAPDPKKPLNIGIGINKNPRGRVGRKKRK